MRLENVVAVTGGRLLNTPAISRFDTVALSAERAARGSLYVAKDGLGIEEAIANGAYGIVTDKEVMPTDPEVAWIRVEDLASAMPKLLRLWLVIHPRNLFWVPPLVMEYLRLVVSDHRVVLLSEDPQRSSEQIFTSHPESTIFSDDRTFLDRIGASVPPTASSPVKTRVVTERLFESSVILDGTYCDRIPVPGCMLPLLTEAIGILKGGGHAYTLSRLAYTPSFEPVFVDSAFRPLPFGEGERVLVFADATLPKACWSQLGAIRWTECKLFVPTQIKFRCDIKIPMVAYRSEEELFRKLLDLPGKPGYTVLVGKKSRPFFDRIARGGRADAPSHTKGLF
ncbi:hypothetical protein [Hydrogenimonas sp.]